MWIKNENGDTLVNSDKVQVLCMDPYFNGYWKIMADGVRIGSYIDEETCKKVFEGIMRALKEERRFYDMNEVFEKKIEINEVRGINGERI